VAIYGGFFGAGMGILTLAALAIQGVEDMQELNGLKNLTSAVNYTVAAATFIIAGAISWPHTLLMIATAMAGAFAGAAFAAACRPSGCAGWWWQWGVPQPHLFHQDLRLTLTFTKELP
jgi:uncharacterized membrane protein YfcA